MGDLLDVTDITTSAFTGMKKARPTDIIGHQKSTKELENRVQEMTTNHEEEIIAVQNAFKRQIADLQKKLSEQEREYDVLMGRLEESRTARECTLQEFNALSDKHDDMQKFFKLQITELTKEKDALKEVLDAAKTATAEAVAAETEELQKRKDDITRLREEKTKLLVDIEQKDRDARYRERILASKSAKLVDTQKEFDKTKEELNQIKSELITLREFRESWDENQRVLVDKGKRIEELEKKVSNLNIGKDKLKQTLIVLDDQLKEFEMTVIEKNDEIQKLKEEKSELESKHSVITKELRVAKNEVLSIKTFKASMQEELKKAESTLEKISTEKEFTVNGLKEQLAKLVVTNQELEEACESILARSQELEASNAHLQNCVDALRTECGDHRDENAVVVNQYIREKNANTQFEAEIQQLKVANEELTAKFDELREYMTLLEFEKNESDVKLSTILKQQIKLIEHLQSANEVLMSKKKKTFVDRILGRDKEKEKESLVPPSPKITTPPAKMKETPSCVLREQNILRYLESEANKLRLQLSYCKAQDTETDKENSAKEDVEVMPSPSASERIKLHNTKKAVEIQTVHMGQGDSDLEAAALQAMDCAVVGEESDRDSDMSGVSGLERDLFFAERQRREMHRYHQGEITETDTDDCC